MNNPTKVSSPIRSVFVKQWESTRRNESSPRTLPIVVVETSSPIPFISKKTNKPQPIIICERITNHNRPSKSSATPPPVGPKSSLTKTWSQLKIISQQQTQNVESDTDSAIHTMAAVITNGTNDSDTLSRSSTSGTTDSTCSSSCSSSFAIPSSPRFSHPTIASTQKQREIISNSVSFKRTCSSPPPPPSVATFTRAVPPIPSQLPIIVPLSSINEDFEQSQPSTLPSTSLSLPETDLVNQYRRLSSPDIIQSDIILSPNSITEILTINTNLPLRYKRDSLIRLYG
jgi:hypothetical protein